MMIKITALSERAKASYSLMELSHSGDDDYSVFDYYTKYVSLYDISWPKPLPLHSLHSGEAGSLDDIYFSQRFRFKTTYGGYKTGGTYEYTI